MKSLLEKEIKWDDIKTVLIDVGPLSAFMSLFRKKKETEPVAYRTVSPSFKIASNAEFSGQINEPTIQWGSTSGAAGAALNSKMLKVERNVTNFKKMYGETDGFALDTIKRALVADLIEEAVKRNAVSFNTYTRTNLSGIKEHFIGAEVKFFEK